MVQPVSAWTLGDETTMLTYTVANAVGYQWQQGYLDENGALVWVNIEGATGSDLAFYVSMDALRYAYRCVAVDAEGAEQISDAVYLLEEIYVAWLNEVDVTEEMLARALAAGSLDALVREGNALVYVYNGMPMARVDETTGYVIDEATGLVVAKLDYASGALQPVSDAE